MSDKDSEDLSEIRKEIQALKKNLKLVSVLGVLLGSGGLFGFYQWFDADRELVIAETRAKTLETEVLKYNTLAADYASKLAPLETRLAVAESQNQTAAAEDLIRKIEIMKEERDKRLGSLFFR